MTEIDPKLSRLYREASTEGPPEVLDAAILAAARKQVAQLQRREGSQRHDGSQRQGRSFWSRWMVPASAIVTLALAVSLAFLVEREQPGTVDGTTVRPVPPRPQSWPPAPVTGSVKPEAADSAAPGAPATTEAPAAAVPAQALEAAAPAQAPESTATAHTPAATLPAPAPVPRPADPAQVPALAAPSPAAPAQSPVSQPTDSASPAAQAFPAESRAKTAAPSAVAPNVETESNVARDSALGGLGAAAPAAPAAAGKLAPMQQQAIQRSPEVWLDEIHRLKREGREQEAAEQLAEFRKAYPLYAVPETILLK